MRGRFVGLALRPPDENGGGELVAAARRLRLFTTASRTWISSSRSAFTGSGSSSGSTAASAAAAGGAAGAAASGAAAAPLPDGTGWCGAAASAVACFGGGIRTRSPGVILPRNSAITGNTTMTLPIQLASRRQMRRGGPVVGLVQHQTPLVVGEPEHEFLFLAAVLSRRLSSVTALMRNFRILLDIFSSQVSRLVVSQMRTAPWVPPSVDTVAFAARSSADRDDSGSFHLQ